MNSDPTIAIRLQVFPPALRVLIDAELAAGNEVTEVSSSFPAPPAGAYARLARSVTTRPHDSSGGLSYRARNTSLYSGEWTDENRFFFVLEPPLPPPPEPDMDAIRAGRSSVVPPRPQAPSDPVVRQFEASMAIDYEKWREGIGYDLSLLRDADLTQRAAIEAIVLGRGVQDWRDVEALAALDTPTARRALESALTHGTAEIRLAVLRHAPAIVPPETKTALLVDALRTATFYGGLTQALREVETFHPSEIIEELLRGTLAREGEVAVHFAAMAMFLHGRAESSFDWSQRPFFLRFHADLGRPREAVFRELCDRIGVKAESFVDSGR